MIATCNQGGSCWTAQSGGMKTVVAQALGCEAIHRGRWDAAAKGAVLTNAAVVDEDQQYVGRTRGSLHRLRELGGVGVEIGTAHLAGKMKVRTRQHSRCTAMIGRLACQARGCRFRRGVSLEEKFVLEV